MLIVHYGLEWSASVFVLSSRLTYCSHFFGGEHHLRKFLTQNSEICFLHFFYRARILQTDLKNIGDCMRSPDAWIVLRLFKALFSGTKLQVVGYVLKRMFVKRCSDCIQNWSSHGLK
jgi:hypothetical protein